MSVGGCSADEPLNPSFPLTIRQASEDWQRMKAVPNDRQRPLVIAAGYGDPGFVPPLLSARMRQVTSGSQPIIPVSFFFKFTFADCRDYIVKAVERVAPNDDPEWTTEVDVIGFSMGGLVVRYAALPREDGGKRLRIARLFTISSPNRGASLASLPTLDSRVRDMRQGSEFIRRLSENTAIEAGEIRCYSRLGDVIVGAGNMGIGEEPAWWVSTPPFQLPHHSAWHDPRILVDIARCLRGEKPFATHPAAPLPKKNDE